MQDAGATSARLLGRRERYVLKEAADEEVVAAVREIAEGPQLRTSALGARLVAAEARERAAAENLRGAGAAGPPKGVGPLLFAKAARRC